MWNIDNIGLNIIHYTVLLHFLFLLLCWCYFERRKIQDYSYRFFVYSLMAIILDGLSILLFINTFGTVSARSSNAITFLIILIIRFFDYSRERVAERKKREELEKNLRALEIEKTEYERSSKEDPLTGCLNRAAGTKTQGQSF